MGGGGRGSDCAKFGRAVGRTAAFDEDLAEGSEGLEIECEYDTGRGCWLCRRVGIIRGAQRASVLK